MKKRNIKVLLKLILACAAFGLISLILLLVFLSLIVGLDSASEILLGRWSNIIFLTLSLIWLPVVKKYLKE